MWSRKAVVKRGSGESRGCLTRERPRVYRQLATEADMERERDKLPSLSLIKCVSKCASICVSMFVLNGCVKVCVYVSV